MTDEKEFLEQTIRDSLTNQAIELRAEEKRLNEEAVSKRRMIEVQQASLESFLEQEQTLLTSAKENGRKADVLVEELRQRGYYLDGGRIS